MDRQMRSTAHLYGSPQPSDEAINESSIWLRRQMNGLDNHEVNSNCNANNAIDGRALLMRCLRELDLEHLELIGIEQQIESIGHKYRSIRQNITTKTNSINLILNDMFANPKQSAQKQTQTDIEDIVNSDPVSAKFVSNSSFGTASNTSRIMNKSFTINTRSCDMKEMAIISTFSEFPDNRKNGLNRLPALVKGYLTRRLMKTEKVVQNIRIIRETNQLLDSYGQQPAEDVVFQRRLETQLAKSRLILFDILFSYPKTAQMALISQLRQHIRDLHFRTGSSISTQSYLTPNISLNGLSSVTRRVMERKLKTRINVSIRNTPQSQSMLRPYKHNTTCSNTGLMPVTPVPRNPVLRCKSPIRRSQQTQKSAKNSVSFNFVNQ